MSGKKRTHAKGEAYTTGDVAEMLGVATRTVCKLHDRGAFSGAYRLSVNGEPDGDRRIPVAALARYCRERGIVLPAGVCDAPWRVLLFACPADWPGLLAASWALQGPPQWLLAPDLPSLGWHCRDAPHLAVCDGRPGRGDANAALAFLAARGVPSVALEGDDGGIAGAAAVLPCDAGGASVCAALAALAAGKRSQ